jgi:DNA invertase Pin-like site-specific DNA recombinase
VTSEYVDHGISGSKEKRPALDKLMADARRRAVDAVVVFRFDRFARSVSHLARALDEFRALGIEFVSLHEAIDTSTPMGRAMFHIAGAFAELEREIIRERVRAGLANAKRRGRKVGRPRAIVGVAKVHQMAANGLSAAIAKTIGVSDYTVRRILRPREKTPSAEGPSAPSDSAAPPPHLAASKGSGFHATGGASEPSSAALPRRRERAAPRRRASAALCGRAPASSKNHA